MKPLLLDKPTTGLYMSDVAQLIDILNRLVGNGKISVIRAVKKLY